jgi:hypothetical protein
MRWEVSEKKDYSSDGKVFKSWMGEERQKNDRKRNGVLALLLSQSTDTCNS